MLAEISTAFWVFWLGVGAVVFVAFAWTMVRLAVRSDETRHDKPPEAR